MSVGLLICQLPHVLRLIWWFFWLENFNIDKWYPDLYFLISSKRYFPTTLLKLRSVKLTNGQTYNRRTFRLKPNIYIFYSLNLLIFFTNKCLNTKLMKNNYLMFRRLKYFSGHSFVEKKCGSVNKHPMD